MATQTGSFDFKAAKLAKESAEKVAINYLAQDTSGIMVYDGSSGTQTPSSPTSGSKNVFIDSDGMYVRNGSTNLASFTGSSAQIGRSNVAHSIVDANGMRVYASDGSTRIANLGYGEGTAESGTSNAPFYTLGTRYPSTAPQYDATSTYAIGDYCDYAGKVWLCTVAIDTPEAFNRSHWRNLIGNESMAEGRDVEASGYSSHAEGRLTRAYGQYSHAEGYSTEAIGEGSHAEGWHDNQQANVVRGISASGLGSHAEGIAKGSFRIIASGMGSHAEGYARDANNIAQGDGSHVEGRGNTASGLYAHAEGNGNTASGGNSHAEGGITTASGGWSHAEGLETEAYGQGSHAQNHGTVADGAYQTALGRYNTPDTTSAVIIGNGTSATRSNALTVDWNGNVNIASGAKYKIDNEPLTDEKVKSEPNTAAGTLYPIASNSANASTGTTLKHSAIQFYLGADSATSGYAAIRLGNNIASGTEGAKQGYLRLYSTSTGYSDIISNASQYRLVQLPDKAGTVAFTSDLTDEKVTIAQVIDSATTTNTYYPILARKATTNGTRQIDETGIKYNNRNGSADSAGYAEVIVGNSTAEGTAGNKRGWVTIYNRNDKYSRLYVSAGLSANREVALPDKSGTIALTSDIPSNTKTTFTPTNGTAYSNYGGCYYEKYGNVVHVHVGVSGLTTGTATTVYTLPEGYRPSSPVFAHGTGGSWNNIGYMEISTAGVVTVRSQGTYCGADVTFMT